MHKHRSVNDIKCLTTTYWRAVIIYLRSWQKQRKINWMTSTRDEAPRTSAWARLYRYVPPQREYVLRRFGLEIGYGFWETKGVYERIYRLIPNEYGRKIRERERVPQENLTCLSLPRRKTTMRMSVKQTSSQMLKAIQPKQIWPLFFFLSS